MRLCTGKTFNMQHPSLTDNIIGNPDNSHHQKRLLAIDGGGMRGMLALKILGRIESLLREKHQNKTLVLSDFFDYVAGTSTGGIIATGIALGLSVQELEAFYEFQAPLMFRKTRNIVKRIFYSKYDYEPLAQKIREIVGPDTKLGSSKLKSLLMLVLMNASTASPWPVSNNPSALYNDEALGSQSNLELPLWQLVRATTAAPYFFEPEIIHIEGRRFVFYDGALTSLNNPAFKLLQMATSPAYRLGWSTGKDKLLLVSVGTGMAPREVRHNRLRDKQVGSLLLNSMEALMYSASTETDLLCRSLSHVIAGDPVDSEVGDFISSPAIGNNPLCSYARFNVQLTPKELARYGCADLLEITDFALDDVASIQACARLGTAVAEVQVKPSVLDGFGLRAPPPVPV